MRVLVDAVLQELSPQGDPLYSATCRERLLMEQLDYNPAVSLVYGAQHG
jgi:hypothetical protein